MVDVYRQLESPIAVIAYHGVRRWREADIDMSSLATLPAVTRALSEAAENGVRRDDALPAAIEDEIERAIDELPQPFRAAARDHFGYSFATAAGITARRETAVAHFSGSKSEDWYRRTRRPDFAGLTAETYVPCLVAAVLAASDKPRAFVAAQQQRNDPSPQPSAPPVVTPALPLPAAPEHDGPDPIEEAGRLARLAEQQHAEGDYESAVANRLRVMEIRTRIYGLESERTMSIAHQVVYSLYELGRYEEALPLLRTMVRVRDKLHGPEDPKTRDARGWLELVANKQSA